MKKKSICILMTLVFVFTCMNGLKKASAALARITITRGAQVVSMPACGGTMELVVTHPWNNAQRDFTVYTNESKKTVSGMATSQIISTSANSASQLTRIISVTCKPNYTGKRITYCILCPDVYISFYQNPMKINIGNTTIDNVLSSKAYQTQCNYRPLTYVGIDSEHDIGLCDYCAGTNLLNRKLALDGLYTSARHFDIKDLLVVSQNVYNTFDHTITKNDIVTVSDRGENGHVFTFKSLPSWFAGFLRSSYTIPTIDNSKSYTLKTIYSSDTGSPLSSKDKEAVKNYLCTLLKEHPEGILVRGYYGYYPESGIGHTIVITYCDGDGQLYAIDTGKSQTFGTKTVKLEDTYLCVQAAKKNSNYNFFDWIHSVSFVQ